MVCKACDLFAHLVVFCRLKTEKSNPIPSRLIVAIIDVAIDGNSEIELASTFAI